MLLNVHGVHNQFKISFNYECPLYLLAHPIISPRMCKNAWIGNG